MRFPRGWSRVAIIGLVVAGLAGNVGSSQKVTINQLVDIAEDIAGIKLKRRYKLDAPKGVNGRNSDNTLIEKVFNWEPSIRLEDGLARTYRWIYDEMTKTSC